ncbi:MAG: DeoR/GlpR transcriptional regulator [Ardenticatenaceae bacterium]|nr:DeoR/GlpR transcriptional regulator [Ardenticatenaceae bacterium]
MLPINRHQKILDILNEQGIVHIGQLSEEFNVSEMTIHRDLAQLETEGYLRKVRGGAVPIPTPPQSGSQTAPNVEACFMCQTIPRSQTPMTLNLADGSAKRACCPHCGLHGLQMMGDQIVSALVTDFLHGTIINAQAAIYLVEPDITVCCTPTVLSFQKKDEALRFQKGFGGHLMSMDETLDHLSQAMKLHQHKHHTHEE